MSKGAWCCGGGDGNTWFGDTYFDAAKWKRGLEFMAAHVSPSSNPSLLISHVDVGALVEIMDKHDIHRSPQRIP